MSPKDFQVAATVRMESGSIGSNETYLAIEAGVVAGAAWHCSGAGAANALVGDATPFCGYLDCRSQRAAGPGGPEATGCYGSGRSHWSGHHGQLDVFYR